METQTILHRIKAKLYENLLTEDPNDFVARVSSERSLNVAQVCTSAATRGGADVSAPSMQHAVDLFLTEMAYLLCDGYSINTGYFTASVHIRGVFNSPNEHFNPQKHSIAFEFQQGAQLRRELQTVEVDILGVADSSAAVLQVTDVKTGSVNDLITPNRNLKIAGHKIKIAGDNPDNGVYLINQISQARIKIDPTDIVVNNPSELIVVLPDLPVSTFKVEVVTQYGVSVLLKEPRTAVFDKILTVA
ncbi:MAG: DUF4469 domain-containing protein [Prevotellaceae bacterium]|jgi:hypothetical protein|nr:DUF4469 domain-containing protein [Prevotellaceae bacterium]